MLLVRNTQRGPTVFSDPKENIAIEWQGAGDNHGGDVQPVPDSLMENVNFLRAVQMGTFVIEEDGDAAQERIRLQIDKINLSRQRQKEEVAAAIDRNAERVIAQAEITEKGEVSSTLAADEIPVEVPQAQPEAPQQSAQPTAPAIPTAYVETDNMVEDGDKLVAEGKEVEVIIEPRQGG